MKPLKNKNVFLENPFLVGDIETLIISHKHKPYAIGFYGPGINQIEFCNMNQDFDESSRNLVGVAFFNLFLTFTKDNNTVLEFHSTKPLTLLFHNLGKFDGLFILKGMFDGGLDKIKNYLIHKYGTKYNITMVPRIRNRIIYQIILKLSYKKKGKNINITIFNIIDSYLILPASLNQLAKSFLNDQKINYDHEIVTRNWLLDHDNMKLSKHYLETDLTLLFRVILSARVSFQHHFNIDILTKLTLPSIALTIFRKNYLEKATLKALDKKAFNNQDDYKKNSEYLIATIKHSSQEKFIRLSYMGGRVDVFKPYYIKKENDLYLNLYDVNSLYPSVMTSEMPCGQAVFIKGHKNIYDALFESKKLGFIEAIAHAPNGLYIPILPVKHKIGGDNRLIFPLGTFKGCWYSEEIEYAMKLGYTFQLQCAWIYPEKHFIFQDYINEIYSQRVKAKHDKNNVMDFIYKLLLNSLYGRLGIQNDTLQTYVVSKHVSSAVLSHFEHLDVFHYENHSMISLKSGQDTQSLPYDICNNDERLAIEHISKHYNQTNRYLGSNSAIHLASAITSKARIEVAKILLKYKQSVYYTDTDSIFLNGYLESGLISNHTLGKWKHEATIKEAYFIAPKSYAYVDVDGKETLKAKGALNAYLDMSFIRQNYYGKPVAITQNIVFPIMRLFGKLELVQNIKVFKKIIYTTVKREKLVNNNNRWVETKPFEMMYNHEKKINEFVDSNNVDLINVDLNSNF